MTALIIACFSLLTMIFYDSVLFGLLVAIVLIAWVYFRLTGRLRRDAVGDDRLDSTPRASESTTDTSTE